VSRLRASFSCRLATSSLPSLGLDLTRPARASLRLADRRARRRNTTIASVAIGRLPLGSVILRQNAPNLNCVVPGFVASAETLQFLYVPRDQGFLLLGAPSLQLPLSTTGIVQRGRVFRIDYLYRAPGRRIRPPASLVVRPFAVLDILGVTSVERAIRAAEDIDPRHTTTMPSSGRLSNCLLWRVVTKAGESAWTGRPSTRFARSGHSTWHGLPRASLRLAEGEPWRVEWCERGDSNPHGIATASPSSWCVCQFRHFREEGRRLTSVSALAPERVSEQARQRGSAPESASAPVAALE
jgi:hypothetical protein